MSKKFGWTEWDNHLLHFRGKPIKILEIGVYKGEAMEKFAQVFLESNKDAEYYGIDTWEGSPEYVEIDFKEIEKTALGKRNASPRKDNIHFIKKESVTALPELVIKKIMFDIIFIDASHTAKDVLYDSTLAMKLLNVNGIVIFDDYLWQKLEPIIFTPKPAIDSILNIFKDELNVLYMGYQVIAKKVNLKFLPKQTDRTIIDGFISLIDNYWYNVEIKENIIFNLKELPEIKPVYDLNNTIKYRKLNGIEIFKKLNLEYLMYKYSDFKSIQNEINTNKDKIKNISKLYELSELNKYSLYNHITMRQNFKNNENELNKSRTRISYNDGKTSEFIIKEQKERLKILFNVNHTKDIIVIDLKNILDDKNNIVNLLNEKKNNNIKTDIFTAIYNIMYPNMTKMYNYILLQILLLKHTLKLGGEFNIEGYSVIYNDLLILLNHIFDKIRIKVFSNKIGSISFSIYGTNFLGINDSLYNKIYDIITTTDKDILSIFNTQNNYLYINIEIYENKIFEMTKKILSNLQKNEKLILQNINKINIAQRKRTLNDVVNFLL